MSANYLPFLESFSSGIFECHLLIRACWPPNCKYFLLTAISFHNSLGMACTFLYALPISLCIYLNFFFISGKAKLISVADNHLNSISVKGRWSGDKKRTLHDYLGVGFLGEGQGQGIKAIDRGAQAAYIYDYLSVIYAGLLFLFPGIFLIFYLFSWRLTSLVTL